MSNALARIQASGAAGRPERTIEVCLAQSAVKRVQALTDEMTDLEVAAFRGVVEDDAPSDMPVRKMGQGADPRIEEIKAELEREYEVMRQATGRLTVAKTISRGEWRQWADKNPAREEGRDERGRPVLNAYDIAVAGGFCNATALLERLGDFATEWDGEPLAEGQWDWLAETAHPGDLKAAAVEVVRMYEGEGAKALPKSSSALSATPASETS